MGARGGGRNEQEDGAMNCADINQKRVGNGVE